MEDDISLDIPFYSQHADAHEDDESATSTPFEHGDLGCWRATNAAIGDTTGEFDPQGRAVVGSDQAIQIAYGYDDQNGALGENYDAEQAAAGIEYIDSQLEEGNPVMVGVNHGPGNSGNDDGLTDHYVNIYGRREGEDGEIYYDYLDPWARNREDAQGTFQVDERGMLVDPEGLLGGSEPNQGFYEVSQVRPNIE